MIVAAYFPPLWYRIMNKRVIQHYGGDLGKANILPSARADLFRRYAPASAAQ
jgi:alkane 1-monooxygenase